MNIKIYQINMERDHKNVCFMGYDLLPKFQGGFEINSTIYDKVFDGEIRCNNLEEVFQRFNLNHPEGYKARSLSKSDIVEVVSDNGKSSFHYVDTFGFKSVSFEPSKTQESVNCLHYKAEEKLKVLLIEPNKYPRMIAIDDTLDAMQKVVNGDIEEYMPFEDEVAIICNDENKINGMKPNRAVYIENEDTKKKEMVDIIFGQFFIVHAPIESERFKSLPPELEKKYTEKFKYPERFVKVGGEIYASPFKPSKADKER